MILSEILKKILGMGNIAIVSGVLLAFGGAATWLREDAISDTNAKWELKAAQAALAAHNEVQERQLLIERLQRTLAVKENQDAEKAKEDAASLAKQAAEFPLSADCVRCRVPNERLWVRGVQSLAPKPSGVGHGAKSPGS